MQVGPEGPHWPSAPLMHHQCTSLSHSTTCPAPQGRCTREHLALAPELANSSTNPALGYQCMIHCGLHPHKSETSAVTLAFMSSCSKYTQLKDASHVSDTFWAMDNVYISTWVRACTKLLCISGMLPVPTTSSAQHSRWCTVTGSSHVQFTTIVSKGTADDCSHRA